VPVVDEFLADDAVQDGLLRTMFSCCRPRLSEPAQVALILNILCCFSVEEIASAFLSGCREAHHAWQTSARRIQAVV
jgi:RNA polymerase sigma-70 factor (ECF subfamily)